MQQVEELINVWDEGYVKNEQFKFKLISAINELIDKDFNMLVQLLYRIDVDETKLKSVLTDNPLTDTAPLIAALMIERQIQKIKFRRESPKHRGNEEDWEGS